MKCKYFIAIVFAATVLSATAQPTDCDILKYADEIRQMHTTPDDAVRQLSKLHAYNFWYKVDNGKITYYISMGSGTNMEFFKEFRVD